MKYGSKDLMRILDIRKKADGDFIEEVKLAWHMANEIEVPGKAMARGYASLEVYRNKYSPIAAIFFSRACELANEEDIDDIQAMASMNSVGDRSEDEIETAYERVPTEQQPASRRPKEWLPKIVNRKKGASDLLSLAKINVVKGEGPNFNAHELRGGTIEVWKTLDDKIRIIYTSNPEPTANFNDKREFKLDDKRETWTMIDFTEVYNMVHLMPLYGTSITGYIYN